MRISSYGKTSQKCPYDKLPKKKFSSGHTTHSFIAIGCTFFFFLTLGIKFMIFNFPFDFILFLLFCGTVVKLYKKDAEVNKKKIWTKNKAIYIKITFYCIVFWDF
jgi:hypothetical protein